MAGFEAEAIDGSMEEQAYPDFDLSPIAAWNALHSRKIQVRSRLILNASFSSTDTKEAACHFEST